MFTGGKSIGNASLTPTTPSSGSIVAKASSSISEGKLALASTPAAAPTIIQDNSTKIQNGQQQTSTALNAWDNMMLENIISRMT